MSNDLHDLREWQYKVLVTNDNNLLFWLEYYHSGYNPEVLQEDRYYLAVLQELERRIVANSLKTKENYHV